MKFECPHCGNAYSVAAARPGQKTRCIKCGQAFCVPDEVEAVLAMAQRPPGQTGLVCAAGAAPAAAVVAAPRRAGVVSRPVPAPVRPVTEPTWPRCQICGGWMHKKTLRRGIFFGIVFSFLLIGIGIVLCLTGIGIVIGLPLLLLGLFWGGKKQKVLACRSCGAVIPRA